VCPKCGHPFRYRSADDARPDEEIDERIAERPAARLGKRPKREPEPPDEESEEREDDYDRDEPPPKRLKKKKKRKKKRVRVPADEDEGEREIPAWVWWVASAVGIIATLVTLLLIFLLANPEGNLKLYAITLLVTLPISTVIFFVAMILCNLVVEAVDIGEIHVAIFKAFVLLLIVNMIRLAPFGNWAVLPVWFAGIMVAFRLDPWETAMLVVFNWGLNYVVNLFLIAMIAGAIRAGQ
jgi:hypothetical protein